MFPIRTLALAAVASLATAAPALLAPESASARELDAYLQCVPYARQVSGIEIYGDAHTWWKQADGRYQRGRKPRVGAVMFFPKSARMQYGHVAAVSRVLDSRRVLLDHANWSPINGRRGQIERDVLAVDVSAANDWSEVRVWYAPLNDLGTTPWAVKGFIYPDESKAPKRMTVAAAPVTRAPVSSVPPTVAPRRPDPSPGFSKAFADLGTSGRSAAAARPAIKVKAEPRIVPARAAIKPAQRAAIRPAQQPVAAQPDIVMKALSRYE